MTQDTETSPALESVDRRTLLQNSLLAGGALLSVSFGGANEAAAAAAGLPDMVRLVVTGNNAQGKSHIVRDEMIKRGNMWSTKAGDPLGPIAPTDTKEIQPA